MIGDFSIKVATRLRGIKNSEIPFCLDIDLDVIRGGLFYFVKAYSIKLKELAIANLSD